MKQYKHIFFDLDDTLWDFERNSQEVIRELYHKFNLQQIIPKPSVENFITTYYVVNAKLWSLRNEGKMNQLELRYTRFLMTLLRLGVEPRKIPNIDLAESYLAMTPKKPHLLPFAKEVLEYLKDKYQLHIISNGFVDVQHIKLESSKIKDYFGIVVTPEDTGFSKPYKEIFEYAMKQVSTNAGECLMIGDNLQTDILGAKNVGMNQVFYNPNNKKHTEKVSLEIRSLQELLNVL